MTRCALYSASRQAYAAPGMRWTPWAADARMFDSSEQAHDYRRNVLLLDNTTRADRQGCYVVAIGGCDA